MSAFVRFEGHSSRIVGETDLITGENVSEHQPCKTFRMLPFASIFSSLLEGPESPEKRKMLANTSIMKGSKCLCLVVFLPDLWFVFLACTLPEWKGGEIP